MCHNDITTEPLMKNDVILHCSDGLYGYLLDEEILDAVVKYHPEKRASGCWRWPSGGR